MQSLVIAGRGSIEGAVTSFAARGRFCVVAGLKMADMCGALKAGLSSGIVAMARLAVAMDG